MKQAGARPLFPVGDGRSVPVHLRDRKGGDPAEWPADLRVQEFPEAGA